MPSAYVVLLDSEGNDNDLTIIGPFYSESEATEWAYDSESELGYRKSLSCWLETQRTLFGGYPSINIVSGAHCESPKEWEAEWDEVEIFD